MANVNISGKSRVAGAATIAGAESGQWALMQRLQEVGLTIVELIEYLDTHVYDNYAIERYNAASAEYRELAAEYEEVYGPLIWTSASMDTASWQWGLQDFPWDYEL